MKKAALLSLGLLLAPHVVQAQTTGGTVTATAVVPSALTVVNVSDLHFGQLTGGAGATIVPGTAPVGPGQTMGELEVTHNSDFSVSVTPPAALVHTTTPAQTITLIFECGYSATSGGPVTLTQLCGSLSNPTHAGDGTTEVTYLQVGGTIATTSGAIPGVYQAPLIFTMTAVY